MIHKIYTVYDLKAEAYLQPFFSPTNLSAIRSIADLLHDPKHMFTKHIEDYSLYCIGEFDDNTSHIQPPKEALLIGKFIEFKPPDEPQLPFP